MDTLLRPLIFLILFVLWIAYTPYLPEVVPDAVVNVVNLLLAVSLILYLIANMGKNSNWG